MNVKTRVPMVGELMPVLKRMEFLRRVLVQKKSKQSRLAWMLFRSRQKI
jgi:hypothetical protein